MLKKCYILGLLLCFASVKGFAQPQNDPLNLLHYDYERRVRFGFTVGLNAFDFSTVNTGAKVNLKPNLPPVKLRADVVTTQPGFSLNGIIDYRIYKTLNLRFLPGICFGSRELRFYDDDAPKDVVLHTMSIVSNYIEMPVHLKYSAKRHSNVRPYVIAGGNIRSNLTYKAKEEDGFYFDFSSLEPFYEVGFGFDFYLTYTKVSFEVKYSKGLQNVIAKRQVLPTHEAYLDAIDKLNSQIIQFSIHFE